MLKRPLHDGPQITDGALKWLDSFLTPDLLVFEWGSGGSTLYIAKRVKKLVSVEHNSLWWEKVTSTAKEWGITNCECVLVEPELISRETLPESTYWDPEFYIGMPPRQVSKQLREEGLYVTFEKYVQVIDKYLNGIFDLVFVDGRARNSCVLHGLYKVKPGGFLILDDAEKKRYEVGKQLLKTWTLVDYYGPGRYAPRKYRSTMVWKKPKG